MPDEPFDPGPYEMRPEMSRRPHCELCGREIKADVPVGLEGTFVCIDCHGRRRKKTL